jgi:hypothetical protein
MAYIIAAVCFVLLVVVSIFSIKIYKESKAMGLKKKLTDKDKFDEEELRRLRRR